MIDSPTYLESLFSPALLTAAVTTIWISLVAQLIGLVIGVIVGPMRQSKFWFARAISGTYVWFFRGSPELLQIIAFYAILPLLGIDWGVVTIGLVALGVNEGARMSEIVRASINSVDVGQRDASRMLGMSPRTSFFSVILPQAAPLIIGPLGNQMNYMFKTSSLVSTIGIVELLRATQEATQTTNAPLALYLAAATIYLAITTAWSGVQRWFENRMARSQGVLRSPHGARGWNLLHVFDTPLPGRQL